MDAAAMQARMAAYFAAEKQEGLVFLAAGLLALGASIWLWRSASPYRAMLYPLGAVALIQLGVGPGVYLRTGGQVADLSAKLAATPAAYRAEETARMEKAMRGFQVYKAIEIAVLAAGIALALLAPHRPALYAAGIGCIAQGALMLVLDLFAEARGREYLAALRALTG